jgi:hypothetical protein
MFFSTIGLTLPAVADEATVSRFGMEAPAGWRRIERAYEGTEFAVEIEDLEGASPTIFGKKSFWQHRGNIRVEGKELDDGEYFDFAKIHNQHYEAFLLKRIDSEWYVAQCRPAVAVGYVRFPDSLPSLCAGKVYHIPSTIVEYGIVDQKHNLAHILKDASTRTDEDGDEVITAEFLVAIRQENSEFLATEQNSRGFIFKVDFLPHRNWCAKRVEYGPNNGKYIRSEVKFAGEGVHPSEILISVRKSSETEFKPKFREKYSALMEKSLRENDFRLTSFGLIEPPEFSKNRTSFSWPTIALCLAILGSAFVAIRHFFFKKQTS